LGAPGCSQLQLSWSTRACPHCRSQLMSPRCSSRVSGFAPQASDFRSTTETCTTAQLRSGETTRWRSTDSFVRANDAETSLTTPELFAAPTPAVRANKGHWCILLLWVVRIRMLQSRVPLRLVVQKTCHTVKQTRRASTMPHGLRVQVVDEHRMHTRYWANN